MAYMKFVGKSDTTKYRDMDSFHDLINYISNPVKARSVGFANLSSLKTAAAEMEAVSMHGRKSSGAKLCHIVITFAPDDLKKLSHSSVDDIAKRCLMYFGNRFQTVYAIHGQPHAHIHIVFNRVSPVDFKRFPDRYEDRAEFWSFLQVVLSNYSIRLWKA